MLQLAIITSALFYLSSGYHPIVDQLQNYVESNQTFASLINKTFDEAGTPNATYTDMYEFFDYWVVKAPNVSHSNFSELLSQYGVDTETGSEIFSSRKAQEWFQAYMNQVKEFCDSPNSTNVVPYWEARSDINMTEYIIPNGGYSSFNAFFSREIQPQYRPIDSPDNDTIITSPCDGQIVEIDTDLQMNKNYTIKGMGYSLSTMLRNDYYAEQFVGGTFIIVPFSVYIDLSTSTMTICRCSILTPT